MKIISIGSWLLLLFCGISYLFWINEWKYHLPTPVPVNYTSVPTGTLIKLPEQLFADNSKPVFIHFFNPECPCSRFNIQHFKSLVKKYNHELNFAVVVMNSKEKYSIVKIQDEFDLNIPVIFDASIAKSCGVYSTPQAVILDANRKLYYRGNYNKSRYCTDVKSDYAKMAIDSLLNNNLLPSFNKDALTAYGCTLSNCTK